jgi:hypothetical protein
VFWSVFAAASFTQSGNRHENMTLKNRRELPNVCASEMANNWLINRCHNMLSASKVRLPLMGLLDGTKRATDLVMIFEWDSTIRAARILPFLLPHHNTQHSAGENVCATSRNAIKESFTLQHRSICGVGDGEDMWRNFMAFDALISLHNLFGVDGKLLVGIDDDTEKPWICLWREREKNAAQN